MLSSNRKGQEIEAYILDIPRFSNKNTVEDTRKFLEILGDPGKESKIIHVAGTNGKGSVCAYLCSILRKSGSKCGMFTSPHLIDMKERFRIDGIQISEEPFTEAFDYVMSSLERARLEIGREDYHPSFFELLFLMGLVIFDREKTEYIILETGLGGRLDATNAVGSPIVTIITQIGMDHMEYLGDSIEQIAMEKAGIIKKGVPVVFCDKRRQATSVIVKEAELLGAELFSVSKDDLVYHNKYKKSIDFSFHTRYYEYIRLTIETGALYQMENASLAVKAIEVISGGTMDIEHIRAGIAGAVWEGRMEEIEDGIFVDGAHNEDGFTAFLETVREDGCAGKRYMLYAASADKDYRRMAGRGSVKDLFAHIAVTRMNNARSASPDELKRTLDEWDFRECTCFESVREALWSLKMKKRETDYIYIVGSLYLVGEVKTLIKEENG